ncbi:MAG: site-2 protease family protein [Burkholderiaceae bacterium]|nr:MAG: site-2 protease family protein [Burkholderiaceae bacterium]
MQEIIQTLTVVALPVIFAITLHEAAHGYVARALGDNTAFVAGRVSLNPLRHIDPVGTLLVPIAILILSKLSGGPAMLFGWAKPVPVNFGNLRSPKRDMRWVALAGPASNLLMALGWAFLIKFQAALGVREVFFYEMAQAGIVINLVLMALNLLPLPPLDGGRIVFSLLPNRLAWQYGKIEPYGMIIMLALFALNVLPVLMRPLMGLGMRIVQFFIGV